METVICSDCGIHFSAKQVGLEVQPSTCPNCKGVIEKLKQTSANYKTAVVK